MVGPGDDVGRAGCRDADVEDGAGGGQHGKDPEAEGCEIACEEGTDSVSHAEVRAVGGVVSGEGGLNLEGLEVESPGGGL